MRHLRALPIVCWLAASSIAHAQSPSSGCPPGQTVTPDTAGHCCWPAQVWSMSRSTCVGLPQCEPGFTQTGESCVAASAPSTSAPPPVAQPAQPPVYSPPGPAPVYDPSAPTYTPAPQQAAVTTTTKKPLKWAIATGVSLLSVGYLAGIIGGAAGLASSATDTSTSSGFQPCYQSWYYSFIPLVGPAITASIYVDARPQGTSMYPPGCGYHGGHGSDGAVQFYGAVATMFQIGGLALIIVGALVKRPVATTTVRLSDSLHLALEPGVARSPVGLTAKLSF